MTVKRNGAALRAAIIAAAAKLDTGRPEHFTRDGRPQVAALSERLGYRVTAGERDAAWAGAKAKVPSKPCVRSAVTVALRRALL